jgi:hypothetical protein
MVIQRPARNPDESFEERKWKESVVNALNPPVLNYVPTITPSGSMTYTAQVITCAKYIEYGPMVELILDIDGTTGGTADLLLSFTLPIPADPTFNSQLNTQIRLGAFTGFPGCCALRDTSGLVFRDTSTNWTLGINRGFRVTGRYLRKIV